MKRLLLILFLFVAIVVFAGFYQGWFRLSAPGDISGSKTNINLEIDRGKMKDDADALTSKAKHMTEGSTDADQTVNDK